MATPIIVTGGILGGHDASRVSVIEQTQASFISIANSAKGSAASVPGWASWDWPTASAWVDSNVESELIIAAPKTLKMLRAISEIVIYLRDGVWPDLTSG
jgi:hypothetical protein